MAKTELLKRLGQRQDIIQAENNVMKSLQHKTLWETIKCLIMMK
jgi:hypothetical protein